MFDVDPGDMDRQIEGINSTIKEIRRKQRNRLVIGGIFAILLMLDLPSAFTLLGWFLTSYLIIVSFILGHLYSSMVELEDSIKTLANVVKMLELEKGETVITNGKQTGI